MVDVSDVKYILKLLANRPYALQKKLLRHDIQDGHGNTYFRIHKCVLQNLSENSHISLALENKWGRKYKASDAHLVNQYDTYTNWNSFMCLMILPWDRTLSAVWWLVRTPRKEMCHDGQLLCVKCFHTRHVLLTNTFTKKRDLVLLATRSC